MKAERGEPERCVGCGGLKRECDHERNSDKVCRCGGRKRRLLSYLDAADPQRRMTLDALDASEPTVAAALEAECGIVSGAPLVCSGSEIQDETGDNVDAALPFLSMGSSSSHRSRVA